VNPPARPVLGQTWAQAGWAGRARAFLWGLFCFEWHREVQEQRARAGDALHLVVFGELVGLPLVGSAVGLRLLPHLYPLLGDWRRRQSADHDVVEEAPHVH
jgi:hypothetical protein